MWNFLTQIASVFRYSNHQRKCNAQWWEKIQSFLNPSCETDRCEYGNIRLPHSHPNESVVILYYHIHSCENDRCECGDIRLPSPTLFYLFLERIMQETLHDHTTTISISGRLICNLCFADNIDLKAGSNSELQEHTNKLIATVGAYGMEISMVKSKVMVNSTNNASVSIIMDGQKLEEVSSFKYLGATMTKDGTCKTEIHIQIAAATAVMARLTRVWKSNISFQTKFKL